MMIEAAGLLATTVTNQVQLTVGGAIIMTVCILLVLGLMGFCMVRILREKEPERHHAPLEINTHDLDR